MDEFPFWSFSLELYGRPGVAPACLALQDRFGCDVNLALFSLWAARCGKALGADEFERLDAAVKPWRTRIVEPIRSLRRSLKTESLGVSPDSAEACRKKLLDAELAAEQVAQRVLVQTVRLEPPQGELQSDLARANLFSYLAWRGVDSDVARQLAGTIVAAA
jgi:uncharacterized protein (TIGR02444 family)